MDIGYIRLLGLNMWSAVKNVVGGEANSFVFQPFHKYITGKKRFLANPKKTYKIISELGLLDGSYVDVAKQSIITKGKKVTDTVLYGAMQAAEYEIRGSYLLGEMTQAEWKAGKVTAQRLREIMDGIAITQGIYTKVDSPLFTQTVLGRGALQFGRWKITNSLLVRRIAKGMKAEITVGNYTGQNTQRMLKMLMVSGTGMYLGYELGKAGYDKGKKAAEAGAELVLTIFDLMSGRLIYDAMANNPTIDTLGSIVFTMEQLAHYISFGIVDEPRKIKFQQGIQDSYVAGLKTLGLTKEKRTAPKGKSTLPSFPKFPTLPAFPKFPTL